MPTDWAERGSRKAMQEAWDRAAREAEMGQMVCGVETTLEEDIIYNPEIKALILETEDKIADDEGRLNHKLKGHLESLVYRAIRAWTGE